MYAQFLDQSAIRERSSIASNDSELRERAANRAETSACTPPRSVFSRVCGFCGGGFVESFVVEKVWKAQPDLAGLDNASLYFGRTSAGIVCYFLRAL